MHLFQFIRFSLVLGFQPYFTDFDGFSYFYGFSSFFNVFSHFSGFASKIALKRGCVFTKTL